MSAKKKLLVLLPFEDTTKARLTDGLKNSVVEFSSDESVSVEQVINADGIIGNPPAEFCAASKRLKWVQVSWAGVDRYTKSIIFPRNIILTNVTGAFGHAISEHMVGCVFSLYKKLNLYRDNQNKSLWLDRGEVKSIEGSAVCILGLGDIGKAFAKRMKALGCYIIGIKRRASEKPDYVDELYLSEMLDEVIPKCDIVAMALPNTPETEFIMNRARIFSMKPGAVLINVGRGNAIDTDALCDALESGLLYGAALDVTSPEPLPSDHRLWKLENAIITPHVSGFYHLRQTYDNIVSICIDNAFRFDSDLPLKNIIDMETGYCR
ncbi:Glyoxylate/hydroxypyruvate reductase A [bioreactor metagenome]|uniref:Glyoxylate/hydroxypyruvate reductase A n=1 Tax=bioreactor metagenome TaxID=1076179 RepID=A0A644ZEU0_9ZZZZ|nr:D-2-hydroxyacid dehydrogenase [Oscillospiraceae bacterium]